MIRRLLPFLFLLGAVAGCAHAQTFAGRSGGDVFVLPPYRLCVGEDNGANACFLQTAANIARLTGQLDFTFVPKTVATLPSALSNARRIYLVTDGLSAVDCALGGGSATALCLSNGSTWQAAAPGTVTSFSSGSLTPLFSSSVATPTTTPALSFSLNTQNANLFFAGPTTGGAAAPTFRALVGADLPNTSPAVVYSTASASTNVGIGATPMATAGASGNTYRFGAYLTQTALGVACTGSTTIDVTQIFTDPNAAGSTNSAILRGTISGNGALGAMGTLVQGAGFPSENPIRAKASTLVQYSINSGILHKS